MLKDKIFKGGGLCVARVPWAWEVWKDIRNKSSEDGEVDNEEKEKGEEKGVDYKRLYLRLDLHTARRVGLGVEIGSWIGLMNRRRIWDACVELLGEYEKDNQN